MSRVASDVKKDQILFECLIRLDVFNLLSTVAREKLKKKVEEKKEQVDNFCQEVNNGSPTWLYDVLPTWLNDTINTKWGGVRLGTVSANESSLPSIDDCRIEKPDLCLTDAELEDLKKKYLSKILNAEDFLKNLFKYHFQKLGISTYPYLDSLSDANPRGIKIFVEKIEFEFCSVPPEPPDLVDISMLNRTIDVCEDLTERKEGSNAKDSSVPSSSVPSIFKVLVPFDKDSECSIRFFCKSEDDRKKWTSFLERIFQIYQDLVDISMLNRTIDVCEDLTERKEGSNAKDSSVPSSSVPSSSVPSSSVPSSSVPSSSVPSSSVPSSSPNNSLDCLNEKFFFLRLYDADTRLKRPLGVNTLNENSRLEFVSPDVHVKCEIDEMKNDRDTVVSLFKIPKCTDVKEEKVTVHIKRKFDIFDDLKNEFMYIVTIIALAVASWYSCFASGIFFFLGLPISLGFLLSLLFICYEQKTFILMSMDKIVIEKDIGDIKTDKKTTKEMKLEDGDGSVLLPSKMSNRNSKETDAYLQATLVKFGQYLRVNYVTEEPDVIGALTSSDPNFCLDTLGKAWFDDCCSLSYPQRNMKAPPKVHLLLNPRLKAKLQLIDGSAWASFVKNPNSNVIIEVITLENAISKCSFTWGDDKKYDESKENGIIRMNENNPNHCIVKYEVQSNSELWKSITKTFGEERSALLKFFNSVDANLSGCGTKEKNPDLGERHKETSIAEMWKFILEKRWVSEDSKQGYSIKSEDLAEACRVHLDEACKKSKNSVMRVEVSTTNDTSSPKKFRIDVEEYDTTFVNSEKTFMIKPKMAKQELNRVQDPSVSLDSFPSFLRCFSIFHLDKNMSWFKYNVIEGCFQNGYSVDNVGYYELPEYFYDKTQDGRRKLKVEEEDLKKMCMLTAETLDNKYGTVITYDALPSHPDVTVVSSWPMEFKDIYESNENDSFNGNIFFEFKNHVLLKANSDEFWKHVICVYLCRSCLFGSIKLENIKLEEISLHEMPLPSLRHKSFFRF